MAKETSKRTTSASRAAGIQAALEKIAASGLVRKLAEEKSEGAYEAEKAMEHGNFARPHFTKVSGTFDISAQTKSQPYVRVLLSSAKVRDYKSLLTNLAETRYFDASVLESAVSEKKILSAESLHYYHAAKYGLESKAEVELSDGLSVWVTVDHESGLPLPRYVAFEDSDEKAAFFAALTSPVIKVANPENYYDIEDQRTEGGGRKS